jgi:hypothetical protein
MKKWIFTALAVSALVLPAAAFAGKDHKYLTFGDGQIVLNEKGKQASITNNPGESGGVYATKAPSSPKLTKVVFKFKSDGDVQGGGPRWSIPIDTDANRDTTESYAFLDPANCGATVGANDLNVVTLVSTKSADCKVFLNTGGSWDNWAAFAAANPSYKLSKAIPFIIADVPGDYHVYDFQFG